MKSICTKCNGTGMYLGNGMIKVECNACNQHEVYVAPTLDKIDRQSESYKTAINDIMKESNLSRKEAVKMFNKAYENG